MCSGVPRPPYPLHTTDLDSHGPRVGRVGWDRVGVPLRNYRLSTSGDPSVFEPGGEFTLVDSVSSLFRGHP